MASAWKVTPFSHLACLPNTPAVYAIYHGDELVYIGQTAHLRERLRCHRRDGLLCDGARLKVRQCRRRGEWLMREYRLIERLQPRLNIHGTERWRRPPADTNHVRATFLRRQHRIASRAAGL